MNIAIDLRPLLSDHETGVTVYTRELTHALLRSGANQSFILYVNSFNKGRIEKLKKEFSSYANARFVSTSYPNKLLNLFLGIFRYPKLDKLIGKRGGERVDIFFAPDPRPAPVSNACKKVTTFHDLSFVHFKNTFSFTTRLWHRFFLRPKKEATESSLIIAVSEATKTDLINTYRIGSDKISVIYEGVSDRFKKITDTSTLSSVQQKYSLPEKFFLSLSTIEPRKNIERLIQAFKIWKKDTHHPHKLVIAGSCESRIFKKEKNLKKWQQDPDIHFCGYVDSQDKPALYSLATALYYISLYEGFGLPIIEADACGTAVVTSDISSMKEIAAHHMILVDPMNVDNIAKSFDEVLDISQSMEEHQPTSRNIFSWDRAAKDFLHSVEEISNS